MTKIRLGTNVVDVDLTGLTDRKGLQWDATSGTWKPGYTLDDNTVHALRSNWMLTGGGTVAVSAGGTLSWTIRFITIAAGKSATGAASGYFDITQPTDGTVITGLGGAANQTCASGIPVPSWSALYYIPPYGSTSSSVPANFRVVTYTSNFTVPPDWILIAVRNGESNYLRLGTGQIVHFGGSINTATTTATVAGSAITSPYTNLTGNTYGVVLTNTAGQSINNATWTMLTFTSARFSTNSSMWVVGTPTRITIQQPGWYSIGANAKFTANATGTRHILVTRNSGGTVGNTNVLTQNGLMAITTASYTSDPIAAITTWCSANDYLEAWVFQSSGAALALYKTDEISPTFYAVRVG